ncbi:hypothetical protein ACMSI6_02495 [Pseudomonas antarctica]|uniref:hypothetical protein n=1 Tax=Pseudomonas antarctica TaxID=219572 RepID=UPI0009F1B06A
MQLGFDRQHFTLPRVGISLRLNKSLPGTPSMDVSRTCGEFLFDFVVKGLVTDQFHLVRIVERLPEPGVAQSHPSAPRPLQCSKIEQHRTFSAGDCS